MDKLFTVVEFETITNCNLKCKYCPNSLFKNSNDENKLMSINIFNKLINDLKNIDYKGEFHPHFYGEPLLDDRIIDFVKTINKEFPKSDIIIYSNGTLLNLDYFKKLINAGCTRIIVTKHDDVTYPDIDKVIYFAKKNKLDDKLFVRTLNKNKLFNRGGLFKIDNSVENFRNCFVSKTITIDYEGNVILCCNDYNKKNILGNIKFEPINQIWESDKFIKIRKSIEQNKPILDICKKCKFGKLENIN